MQFISVSITEIQKTFSALWIKGASTFGHSRDRRKRDFLLLCDRVVQLTELY
jgi:hypothetical protein